MALTKLGLTTFSSLGVTGSVFSPVKHPLEPDTIIFAEYKSSTSVKCWKFTWPNTIVLLKDLSGLIRESSIVSYVGAIGLNPSNNQYYYCFGMGPFGSPAYIYLVDVNVSTGAYSQSQGTVLEPNSNQGSQVIQHLVTGGTLYFVVGGSAQGSANSLCSRKTAGSAAACSNINYYVGSIGEGLYFPSATPAVFYALGGDWRLIDFSATPPTVTTPSGGNPYSQRYNWGGQPLNGISIGNDRYYFMYGATNNHYLAKWNVSTKTGTYVFIATGTATPYNGFDILQLPDSTLKLAYTATNDLKLLHYRTLNSDMTLGTDSTFTPDGGTPSINSVFTSSQWGRNNVFVIHTGGSNGQAISKYSEFTGALSSPIPYSLLSQPSVNT